ncbi:MAG TPA: hypothetical protein VFZ64_09275 [Nocardioidaceae bacterium]
MPLGQGIGDMWEALRDRVEVSGHEPTWEVTAGSFDAALSYARERFDDPVVLRRQDRARLWPRVTLTVTTDRARASAAPSLAELAEPVMPRQHRRVEVAAAPSEQPASPDDGERSGARRSSLPSSLEAIFAHQEELREARRRRAEG